VNIQDQIGNGKNLSKGRSAFSKAAFNKNEGISCKVTPDYQLFVSSGSEIEKRQWG
jgi:hypothetical protein